MAADTPRTVQCQQILNRLYAGETVTVKIPASELEQFRQTMYNQKKLQDEIMKDLLEEDRKTLNFAVVQNLIPVKNPAGMGNFDLPVKVRMSLAEKPKFNIEFVDE